MNNSAAKQCLFVSGIQRSGTTALANLLNHHSEITICIERYKKIMKANKFAEFGPHLFERDRLLDFSDGYTNLTPEKSDRFSGFYQRLSENYDELKYIGDKVPNNHEVIPAVHQSFPSARTLFIVRDIIDTACSWQARADREGDGWPEEKTAEKSVGPWNDCIDTILQMRNDFPSECLVISYSAFFDGHTENLEQIRRVTDFLELELERELITAFQRARQTYESKIKSKPRQLDSDAKTYLDQHANYRKYNSVLELAGLSHDHQDGLRRTG